MTKREYDPSANEETRVLIKSLFGAEAPDTSTYSQGMRKLGRELGEQIVKGLAPDVQKICLACVVEDADFFAQGVLEILEARDAMQVALACFWNEKSIDVCDMDDFDIAPILKSYIEPAANATVLVVAKSIISGGCVVATNIMNLIGKLRPTKIFVVAPVMVDGAKNRLEQHFSNETLKLFEYKTLAVQFGRGEGKSIYERYGWKGSDDKNKYLPAIVKERRSKFASKPK